MADQVSVKSGKNAETCWSEAEIPSKEKRQRGTLNTETFVMGLDTLLLDEYERGCNEPIHGLATQTHELSG